MRALLVLTVLAGALVTAGAWADEETMPFDKLPQAVKDGFKKRFPDAKPTDAAKETENGKTMYEVTFKEKGKNMDITFTEAGVLTTIEKEIDKGDLPKAVTAALDKKYPGAKYKMVEEVIKVVAGKESTDYYEAELELADKKVVEVEVLADGTIKKTEEKKDEKKD